MRILLTGGTGLIGRALCRYWALEGHDLIVWSRDPARVPELCSGACAVASLEELDHEPPLDVVVNLAGAPIADRVWTDARRKLLWESRVDLTRQLVDWLGRQPQRPEVLVSGSAVGWYGDAGEHRVDEFSPAGQEDFASELCLAWEQAALEAAQYGIRVCCVRTGLVLAPDGGMLARLLPVFRLGMGGRLGDGRQWMSWVHLRDEVGLIDHLVHNRDCQGSYNACAPNPVRNADFTRLLAQQLHRPALLPVPSCCLRLLGEMSDLLLTGQHVTPTRALQAGYHFHFTDLERALANLLGQPD